MNKDSVQRRTGQPGRFAYWIKAGAFTASLAAATLLVACGGGGSSDSPPVVATPQTGQFIDSAVEGLGYRTATQTGTTDASGQFKYLPGETVTFKLYGQDLSSSIGFTTLTPSDTGTEETNLDRIVNQLRFLQTLDTDNDPTNGIRLPAFSGSFNINFAQSIEDFENDAAVLNFLTANASGRPLVSIQNAVAHFGQSINSVSNSYSLNLNGRSATSTIINTACTNNVQAQQRYSFGATSVTLSGSDGFVNSNGTCTVNPDATEVVAYTNIVPGDFLACLPNCGYKDVNFIRYGTDPDLRTVVELSWHTPGTQKIRYIKRVLVDPSAPGNAAALTTFKETITLN